MAIRLINLDSFKIKLLWQIYAGPCHQYVIIFADWLVEVNQKDCKNVK